MFCRACKSVPRKKMKVESSESCWQLYSKTPNCVWFHVQQKLNIEKSVLNSTYTCLCICMVDHHKHTQTTAVRDLNFMLSSSSPTSSSTSSKQLCSHHCCCYYFLEKLLYISGWTWTIDPPDSNSKVLGLQHLIYVISGIKHKALWMLSKQLTSSFY